MSRYRGPKQRINRRFNQAIFAPGKAFENKAYPPGVHGPRLRRKTSEYAVGLNEKQKLRFMYGLSEKQFRLLFERAKLARGVTGEVFLRFLEMRLDNIVYRLGWARSRASARQFVNHGHIFVNGRKVDISSYICKPGDEITVCSRTSSRQLATRCTEETQARVTPAWLVVDSSALTGHVNREPVRDEAELNINEQLIVEFYSR
jgi:small subunit ribosomal protein S4